MSFNVSNDISNTKIYRFWMGTSPGTLAVTLLNRALRILSSRRRKWMQT